MDYKEEQVGEIEALQSIYEGDLEGNNLFSLKLYIWLKINLGSSINNVTVLGGSGPRILWQQD